jgi:hypothetical protein
MGDDRRGDHAEGAGPGHALPPALHHRRPHRADVALANVSEDSGMSSVERAKGLVELDAVPQRVDVQDDGVELGRQRRDRRVEPGGVVVGDRDRRGDGAADRADVADQLVLGHAVRRPRHLGLVADHHRGHQLGIGGGQRDRRVDLGLVGRGGVRRDPHAQEHLDRQAIGADHLEDARRRIDRAIDADEAPARGQDLQIGAQLGGGRRRAARPLAVAVGAVADAVAEPATVEGERQRPQARTLGPRLGGARRDAGTPGRGQRDRRRHRREEPAAPHSATFR